MATELADWSPTRPIMLRRSRYWRRGGNRPSMRSAPALVSPQVLGGLTSTASGSSGEAAVTARVPPRRQRRTNRLETQRGSDRSAEQLVPSLANRAGEGADSCCGCPPSTNSGYRRAHPSGCSARGAALTARPIRTSLGSLVTAQLSPTGYVVLGLVSVRPRAGHELAGYAQRSIGNFFPLTRSHVYSELDRLCRLGLLEATEVPQERFPTKRVYEITAEGEEVLRAWLEDSPVERERHRDLFLVRVFFGDRMSSVRLEAILDEYEVEARVRRDRLGVLVEGLADRPQAGFRRATAMFGVRREQAKLDWVADVRPLLAAAGSLLPGGAQEC